MVRKSYLVTGGCGFLGASLVHRLVENGHFVRVLDNEWRASRARLNDLTGDLEFLQADIRDAKAVDNAVKGVDAVVHLAFVNGTAYFYEQPDLVLDVGVKGIVNVIDACKKNGVGDLAVASSSEVYNEPDQVPTDESVSLKIPDPLNPRYSYSAGKMISEIMALNSGRAHFDRVVIFRPHNVYGPDMGWHHVIPEFVTRARNLIEAQPEGTIDFEIQGNGKESRAFVHVDDFTDGLVRVLEKGEHLQIYHIGNDEETQVCELVKKMFAYFGRDFRIVPGEKTAGSPKRRCPDIRKLRKIGYEPRVSLQHGLTDVIEWYCAHQKAEV
jgi:nucleoside-diphosphate-sugar epimerase